MYEGLAVQEKSSELEISREHHAEDPDQSAERRDQFGHTWEQREKDLRERLSASLTSEQLKEEIQKQWRMFKLYQDLAEAPDGRQLQLDRSLAATAPESQPRVLEAAKKSWS